MIHRRNLISSIAATLLASSLTPALPTAAKAVRQGYSPAAVNLPGDTLLRRTGLIGPASPQLLVSAWLRSHWDGSLNRTSHCLMQCNGNDQRSNNGTTVFIEDGVLFVNARESDDNFISFYNPAPPSNIDQWYHWLFAANCAVEPFLVQFYVNDAPIELLLNFRDGAGPMASLDTLGQTFYMPDWKIENNTQPPMQDMADFWLGAGQFLDLRIEANRRKFITTDKRPVHLGVQGRTPTGTRPTVFFSGNASRFIDNRGDGGPFTVVGQFADAGFVEIAG